MPSEPAPARRNSDLRRHNSLEVVDLLRAHGRQSRAELGNLTTLSNQALALILNDLVQSGHAVEVETKGGQRGRGRPAIRYEYDASRESVISLYIGLRYCEVVACDGLGRPLTESVEFTPGWEVDRVVAEAASHIADIMRQCRLDRRSCHIGTVIHGWVNLGNDVATSATMSWDAVPIASLLAEATGITATVHEASRAAAVAEYREGAAAGAHRAIVFNAGPEITATHLTDGLPDTGAGGLAGVIGACPVPDPDGDLVTIDALVGSVAIRDRYIEASGNHVDWVTEVFALAREGDAHARQVLELPIDALGYAASWLVTMTNPERLVLTGAMSEYDEALRGRLHGRIVDLTDPRILRTCRIDFSSLGRQAWVRGGVHAALDHQRSIDPLAG
ncbi:MAG: ROK family protein [Acidimicrobiales bacterium]